MKKIKGLLTDITYEYLLALSLIAVLSLIGYFGFMYSTGSVSDPEILNMAGRQRMLQQRAAMQSAHLAGNQNPAERIRLRKQLIETIDLFEKGNDRLAGHVRVLRSVGLPNHELKKHYFNDPVNLDKKSKRFINEVKKLASAPDDALSHTNANLTYILLTADSELLKYLDEATTLFQRQSESRVGSLRLMATGLFALILVALGLEMVFIFRPMAQRVYRETENLTKSEQKLRGITTSLGEGVIVIDTTGRLTFMNPYAERILGWTEPELNGKDVLAGFISEKDEGARIRQSAETGSFWESETQFIKKNGQLFPAAYTVSPLKDRDSLTGVVIAFRDITYRVAREKEIRNMSRVIEQADEMVLITDKSGSMIYANPAAEKITGYTNGELLGNNPRILKSGIHDAAFYEAMWSAILAGEVWKGGIVNKRKSGELFHEELTISPILSDTGEVTNFAAIIRDVTKQKEAENRLRTLSGAVEHADETIVITDPDGVVQYVNPAGEKNSGYSAGELIGGTPKIFKSGVHDDEFYRDMWTAIKSGEIWRGEIINMRKSGELCEEEITISPVKTNSGEITHFVAIKRDITDRKKIEQDILLAKKQAEEATALKDKFVSYVAHDLKSPFNAILGFLRLIKKRGVENLNDVQKELIDRSINNGESLSKMIDELLDISRLKTGAIDLKPEFIDLRNFADMMLEGVSFAAGEKGVELINNVPENSRIYADKSLFSEVIRNLLSNAVKFSYEGGAVTIFAEDGKNTTVAVHDTGTGIPQSIKPLLFSETEKISTPGTAGEKGTGLGLTFAYEIMKAHGGALRAESAENEGSVFYAELPSVKPLIMVVDDQKEDREFITTALSGVDFNVVTAGRVEEVIKLMEISRPHLIISDMHFGADLNGIDLIKHLRKNRSTESTPVIMVTADDDPGMREEAFKWGANEYINKPFAMADFSPRVKRFLG